MEEYVARTMEALKSNRMTPYYLESREEVVPLLKELIPEGASVTLGGSVTLEECGALDLVRKDCYKLYNRYAAGLSKEEMLEVLRQGLTADVMLSSTNAITEDGYLYNVDRNSNRVAGLAFGPRSVVIVAGINKIVPTLDDAIRRVKTVAAPLNAARLNTKTFCQLEGECVSLSENDGDAPCSGCAAASRLCCSYLISGPQCQPGRIKVILVGEELGY